MRHGWQDYDSLLSSPGSAVAFAERDRSEEEVLRSKAHRRLAKDLLLEGTLELAANRLTTDSSLTYEGARLPLPNAVASMHENRAEAGADLTWTPEPRLQVTAGMHAERSSVSVVADDAEKRVYSFVKPVLRASYAISPRQELRVRVEREVGQLAFSGFIAAAALDRGSISTSSSGISPQRDWVVEASYEGRTRLGSALTLTVARRWLRDVVDWLPVPDATGAAPTFDARGNIGDGDEERAVLSATLPLGGLGVRRAVLNVAATYDRAEVVDPVTLKRRDISDLKPFTFTMGLQQEVPSVHLSWGANLEGPWRTDSYRLTSSDRETASTELDLFADLHPRPHLSLRLDLKDLLRRRYGRVVSTFSGLRTAQAFLYADDRVLRSGPSVSIRLRRDLSISSAPRAMLHLDRGRVRSADRSGNPSATAAGGHRYVAHKGMKRIPSKV